jgi:hypothetical protein
LFPIKTRNVAANKINKARRLPQALGDTGAGSPFVAVALASMAGRQSGGATLVANLRRNDGATLLLVTPPSAEQMAKDAAIKRPFWPRPGFGG